MKIDFSINGRDLTVRTSPWRRLLDVLRDDLGLTGCKEGCGEGECGACTVLVDDEPANACLVPVGQVHGHRIRTVEGLASAQGLHPVQKALLEFGGTQCGICTPGIAICAVSVLERNPNCSREQLRTALAGNLCRCTGYQLIVDALCAAAEEMRSSEQQR